MAVLIIAGWDSSGGAGVLRDLQTCRDLEVDGRAVITAVTAQTESDVLSIDPVDPQTVAKQIAAAMARKDISAIKIGMLAAAPIVMAVADALRWSSDIPIVLDPVLASTSGKALLDQDGIGRMRERLFPICRLVTPNLPEAEALTGLTLGIDDEEAAARLGQKLLLEGIEAVLIKGGHSGSAESIDYLMARNQAPEAFRAARFPGTIRGTGCSLSSALAAHLSQGMALPDACREAKAYVTSLFEAKPS